MPQQCCPLPLSVVCGARALCIRKLWHFAHFLSTVKTCQDMSSFLTYSSPSPPVPRFSFLRHFLQAKAAQSFARTHAHRIAVVVWHFSLRQLAAKVAAFHFFLLSMPHSTPPTAAAATRSQLGLVIHTKRHELVVVTVVVVAVVVVTVVAVVSVAAVAVAVLLLIFCSLACD